VRNFPHGDCSPDPGRPGFTVTSPNPVVLNNKRPTFEWDSVPDALTYTLEVSVANTFANQGSQRHRCRRRSIPLCSIPHRRPAAQQNILLACEGCHSHGRKGARLLLGHLANYHRQSALDAGFGRPGCQRAGNHLNSHPGLGNSTLPLPAGSTTFANYNLQVDNNNDFNSPEIEVSTAAGNITASKYDVLVADALAPKTTYYWRVNAESNVGVSAWSLVRTFRTPLAAPVLTNQPLAVRPPPTARSLIGMMWMAPSLTPFRSLL